MRRALGFKLNWQGRVLLQFIDYLDASGASVVTTEQALAWAQQPANAQQAWRSMRLALVRGFARHLQSIDPRTEVPPKDLLKVKFPRAIPYLYSAGEITDLMAAARSLPSPLRAATMETLIGLVAVTGMRLGEAIGLDREDVDLSAELLVVHLGKNRKSREVPLHSSTVQALDGYCERRDQLCPRPQSSSFFITPRGNRLHPHTVGNDFDLLRRQTGLHSRGRTRPPRLHDLRHTFVLRTLLNWHRMGTDVQAQLPLLSTYLGHVDPSSTYWYFEGAPELLNLAAERLEQAWDGLP